MDFDKRISEAQNQSNTSYQTYNDYQAQADAAGNKYGDIFDNRQSADQIMDSANDRYINTDEINNLRGNYQTARDAVNQLNTTINRLPESIRQQYGGTGLTEAQRQRALQNQYQTNANTYNMLNTNYQNALADYNTEYDRAIQQAQYEANMAHQNQWNSINQAFANYEMLMNQRNTAYQQNLADRGLLADQYGARDNWQLAQDQMELQRWQEEQANARAAAQRSHEWALQDYLQRQNAEAAQAQANLQSQLADRQSRADYNRYKSEATRSAREQYDRDAGNLMNSARLWLGGNNVAYDNLQDNMNSILTYEQWAGLA